MVVQTGAALRVKSDPRNVVYTRASGLAQTLTIFIVIFLRDVSGVAKFALQIQQQFRQLAVNTVTKQSSLPPPVLWSGHKL